MAFTDPADFEEVIKEGDAYLSKVEEELGNEEKKQVLSRERICKNSEVGNNKFSAKTHNEVSLEATFPTCSKSIE